LKETTDSGSSSSSTSKLFTDLRTRFLGKSFICNVDLRTRFLGKSFICNVLILSDIIFFFLCSCITEFLYRFFPIHLPTGQIGDPWHHWHKIDQHRSPNCSRDAA